MRPKLIITRLAWMLLLMGSVIPPVRAQRVDIYVSSDSVLVGEHFLISLSVAHDAGTMVSFPEPARGDTLFGDVVLLAKHPVRTRIAGGTTRVDSVVYEAAAFAVDTARVPPMPIRLTVNEQTSTIGTPALAIPIVSTVPTGAQSIKDLAPIVPFARPWWAWFILALVILIGVAAWWQLIAGILRNRKRQTRLPAAVQDPYLSPYEEAQERLTRLGQTDSGDPRETKPFYVELSDVLRTYLQRRLELPAFEETSRELVTDLSRLALRRSLPARSVDGIAHVLEIADLVKFADQQPPAATGHALVEKAARALQDIEARLQPADATETALLQST